MSCRPRQAPDRLAVGDEDPQVVIDQEHAGVRQVRGQRPVQRLTPRGVGRRGAGDVLLRTWRHAARLPPREWTLSFRDSLSDYGSEHGTSLPSRTRAKTASQHVGLLVVEVAAPQLLDGREVHGLRALCSASGPSP